MQLNKLQHFFYQKLPKEVTPIIGLLRSNRIMDAIELLEMQIKAKPSAPLCLLLSDCYHTVKNIPKMLEASKAAFVIEKSSYVLLKLIYSFYVAKSFEFCREWLFKIQLSEEEQSLAFDCHLLSGMVHYGLDDYRAAISFFEKALEENSHSQEAIYYIGQSYYKLGEFRQALLFLEKALRRDPSNILTLHALSSCYKILGDYRRGVMFYLRLLRLEDLDHLRFNLSFMLLSMGKYQLAAPFYEYRELLENKFFSRGYIAHKKWQGEDLTGKNLLVYSEQGHGDNFHFARFLPRIQAKYNCTILFIVRQLTKSLLKSLPNIYLIDEEAIKQRKIILPKCDYVTHLMSLIAPIKFSLKEEKKIAAPYLEPSHNLVIHYQKKIEELKETRLKVGVIWAGSALHQNDVMRSIKATCFAPLLEAKNCAFFSLQVGERADDLGSDRLYKLLPKNPDFEHSAALIETLDLVVTVDTSIAHVTGAIGKPIWCMLTQDADWRWGIKGEDTNWYPSMRLIRQKKQGDWEEVIARVSRELEAKAAAFLKAAA